MIGISSSLKTDPQDPLPYRVPGVRHRPGRRQRPGFGLGFGEVGGGGETGGSARSGESRGSTWGTEMQDSPAEMLRDTGLGRVEGAWEPRERLTNPRQSRPFKPGETTGGAGVEPKVRRS